MERQVRIACLIRTWIENADLPDHRGGRASQWFELSTSLV